MSLKADDLLTGQLLLMCGLFHLIYQVDIRCPQLFDHLPPPSKEMRLQHDYGNCVGVDVGVAYPTA